MMSRKRVAMLFVIYFVAAVIYAFVTYVISGALPFAVWGARGFKAAHAKSLFIPWAIIAVLLIIAGE
jgi:hypothetical protein